MIEIRELVIRATVEDSPPDNSQTSRRENFSDEAEKKGCCSETMDILLQIINDKKER
ncbi:MAG TPA: DUF5908 family protein [Draconibacterium sp.]|nr:DUF5908 family protein [Draconibacterium sp.]